MYYYEYETLSQNTMKKLWDIINNASPEDWWREANHVEWKLSVPYDTFVEDPKTQALITKFVEPTRLYIQRLEPKTCYNWHIDYARYTSITMGMNVFEDSMTLFGGPREYGHIPNLDPLYYTPDSVYLIDGSLLHCGLNLSNQTRYLLSLSLTPPTTMQIAIGFLKEQFPK